MKPRSEHPSSLIFLNSISPDSSTLLHKLWALIYSSPVHPLLSIFTADLCILYILPALIYHNYTFLTLQLYHFSFSPFISILLTIYLSTLILQSYNSLYLQSTLCSLHLSMLSTARLLYWPYLLLKALNIYYIDY